MKNRITIGVQLADILAPYPESTAEKIECELKQASTLVKRGVHRITAEALFAVLQKNRIWVQFKNNPSTLSQGNTKMQKIRLARQKAEKETIKSVLTADGDQSPKKIYTRYVKKAKSENKMPYSYAWFRVLYGEIRN